MSKIIKTISKALSRSKRISRQHRSVTITSGEYKIIIPKEVIELLENNNYKIGLGVPH